MSTQITAIPQGGYPAPPVAGYPMPVQVNDDFSQAEGSGGVDIWGVVFRRKWLLILGLLVGLLGGYLMLTRAEPVYESASQVLIAEQRIPILTRGYDSPQVALTSNEEKHALTIKSPMLVSRAVSEHKLEQLPSMGNNVERAINSIMEGLSVVPMEGTDIYVIKFRGKKPEDTQKVVSAIQLAYQEFLEEGQENSGQQFRETLEQAKKELDEKLKSLNDEYIKFQETSELVYMDGKAHNIPEASILDLEQERGSLAKQRLTMVAELDTLRALVKEGQDPDVVAHTIRSNFESTADASSSPEERALIPLLVDLASLKKRYGADHPQVKQLQSKIDATTKFLNEFLDIDPFAKKDDPKKEKEKDSVGDSAASRFVKLHMDMLETKLRQNDEATQLMTQEIEKERRRAEALKGQLATESKYRDEIENRKMFFRAIVEQLTKTEIAPETGGVNFQALAEPTFGVQKEPQPTKYLGMGAMLGLMAGFGLGYLVELTDKAFRSPQEIAQALHTVVVGHIPHMEKKRLTTLPGSKLAPVLCTVHRPKSSYAESYRNVRTAVYFSIRGQHKRILQVTSPTPGDGKSTLAANLAVTMAQSGKRVLLMDADFRRPTQHSIFGLDNRIGLASVVDGTREPADVRHEIPEVPNLHVMPSGEGVDNPSELLTSQAFEDLLALFRDQYDFVLVDSPPLLVVSDPGAVAARVDSVLLTFRIDKHAKPVAKRARELLADLGAPVIGVVVNGISQDSVHYNQYGYGYGYGYGGYGRYGKYGKYGSNNTKTDERRYLDDVPVESKA